MDSRIDIQMAKDGSRTIIVIDGDIKKRDELALQLITLYCSSDESASASPKIEMQPVRGMSPIKAKDKIPTAQALENMVPYSKAIKNAALISSGKYRGMTAAKALEQDAESALVALFNYVSANKSIPERTPIIEACVQWMTDVQSLNRWVSREDKCHFLSEIRALGDLDALSNMRGYQNIDAFIKFASDEEVNMAFEAAREAIHQRGLKNKRS